MSIIEKTSKLNLLRQIAIVTDASSTLGAVICRTLLAHNARVLGVNSGPIHPSLNAAHGTHMQFYRCDESTRGKDMMQARLVKFDGAENIDLVVSLGDGNEDLMREVVEVMRGQGGGMVLRVGGSVEKVLELANSTTAENLRFNMIADDAVAKDATTGAEESVLDRDAFAAVKSLKGAHDSTDEHVQARGVANLILFLASKHCEGVNRRVVRVDGSCVAF